MPSNSTTNIAALRRWFRQCPALSDSNRFHVDFLAEAPTEYALYSVPSTINYRENVLGDYVPEDIQTVNYIFASRESYGVDVQQALAALGFYDAVVDWIIEQSNARNFPQISDGEVISVAPTLTAYPAEVGSDAAKYQIQLRLVYRRE